LPAIEEIAMTSIYILSGGIAVLLLIYLVIVLLKPESFS
jgi:K+-transporting ATPase KdpF subunit